MAYAVQLIISTGNRVSVNYQSQEVSVTLTYQLEREDNDVQAVVREKTAELAQAHQNAWQTLRDAKVAATEAAAIEATAATPVIPEAEPNAAAESPAMPAPEVATTVVEAVSNTAESETPPGAPAPLVTAGQATALVLLLNQAGWSDEQRQAYLRERYACGSIDEMTAPQAAAWLLELQRASRLSAQQQRLAAMNGSQADNDSANGAKTIRYARTST